jgi:limonene-1,2-epoxide hydrolase
LNTNEEIINTFYSAFSNSDIDTMAGCYHKNIIFEDPAFGKLHADEVIAMWKMLLEKSKGDLKITFSNIVADKNTGQVIWIATYNFSKTGRKVINAIQAHFEFENGLIIKHTDEFDLWKWSRQALGFKGFILGWTQFMKNKIQQNARLSLKKYMEKA